MGYFCSNKENDRRIAKIICEGYGELLYETQPGSSHKVSGRDGFDMWRMLCLGSYHPVYFPNALPVPHRIRVGGNGGENHRPFYAAARNNLEPEAFFNSRAKLLKPDWLISEFKDDLEEWSKWKSETDLDPLIWHYRSFRNRFHSGRVPQSAMGLHPLSSSLLDQVSKAAGADRIHSGQILFDIMGSLDPRLLDFEFDEQKKAPTDTHRAALVKVSVPREASPGIVFGSPVPPTQAEMGMRPVNLLAQQATKASQTPFVKCFFEDEQIGSFLDILRDQEDRGNLRKARDGAGAAALIAASLFFPD